MKQASVVDFRPSLDMSLFVKELGKSFVILNVNVLSFRDCMMSSCCIKDIFYRIIHRTTAILKPYLWICTTLFPTCCMFSVLLVLRLNSLGTSKCYHSWRCKECSVTGNKFKCCNCEIDFRDTDELHQAECLSADGKRSCIEQCHQTYSTIWASKCNAQ